MLGNWFSSKIFIYFNDNSLFWRNFKYNVNDLLISSFERYPSIWSNVFPLCAAELILIIFCYLTNVLYSLSACWYNGSFLFCKQNSIIPCIQSSLSCNFLVDFDGPPRFWLQFCGIFALVVNIARLPAFELVVYIWCINSHTTAICCLCCWG